MSAIRGDGEKFRGLRKSIICDEPLQAVCVRSVQRREVPRLAEEMCCAD